MHRSLIGSSRLFVFALLSTLVATGTSPARDLSPKPGFRVRLEASAVGASVDAAGAQKLTGLTANGRGTWPPKGTSEPAELQLLLPKGAERSATLLVLVLDRPANGDPLVSVEAASKPTRGFKAAFQETIDEPGRRTLRVTVPKGRRAIQVRVGGASKGAAVARIQDARIYNLDPKGRNDYWLFIGASITAGAVKPDTFAKELAARFPGYEPYVANEAVSGWGAGKLLAELPAILERHPHARYVAIHIGGNDVSGNRPWPGGRDRLNTRVEKILQQLVAAGKVPILARLTFRAYKAKDGKPAVGPPEGGSGPYVENIYDPLIAKYCPDFFDRRTKKGRVNLYDWFQAHPEEIGGDGIHLKAAGSKSFRRIFAEGAGDVIYPGQGR
ncbi:MAG: SGNH/GDSL hydrolase family protein [Planctomycetota bacterium]|jgi:lysophospholipase L1-like esterase